MTKLISIFALFTACASASATPLSKDGAIRLACQNQDLLKKFGTADSCVASLANVSPVVYSYGYEFYGFDYLVAPGTEDCSISVLVRDDGNVVLNGSCPCP